jgi:hypothetical protein
LPHTPSSHVLLMPNSKHLTRGISNLVSLITKTKLGLSSSPTYLLTKALNATTPTNVATAPAWEQHPCLIPLFTAHPGTGDEKAATIHTTSSTVLQSTPPSSHKTTTTAPGFPGARPYPFLDDPLSYVPTRPRLPSINKGMTPVR